MWKTQLDNSSMELPLLQAASFRRKRTGDHRRSREEALSTLRDSATSSQDGKVIEKARMEDLDYGTVGRCRNAFRAERAGSGMGAIANGWAAAGYPEPRYEVAFGSDRTTLTLPLAGATDESDDNRQVESSDSLKAKSDARAGKTGVRKRAVAEHLTMNGPSKSSDTSAGVGLKTARTNRLLRQMVAEGSVRAEGRARNRVYARAD